MYELRMEAELKAVHPHARGDNKMALQNHITDLRFTPTPVGTIPGQQQYERGVSVHPHARGDNAPQRAESLLLDGSPPRPWGQYPGLARAILIVRFTPTPVGTIMWYPYCWRSITVHPHARGDNKRCCAY